MYIRRPDYSDLCTSGVPITVTYVCTSDVPIAVAYVHHTSRLQWLMYIRRPNYSDLCTSDVPITVTYMYVDAIDE